MENYAICNMKSLQMVLAIIIDYMKERGLSLDDEKLEVLKDWEEGALFQQLEIEGKPQSPSCFISVAAAPRFLDHTEQNFDEADRALIEPLRRLLGLDLRGEAVLVLIDVDLFDLIDRVLDSWH